MKSMPNTRTLDQIIAAIEALDLEPIKFKATRPEDGYGWSPEHAERMAQSYRRYLMLQAKYPEVTLAPDQDTDRFWHMHILDTRKYAADCETVFGEFLHHFPYLGTRGEDDARALDEAFARLQALMTQEFGAAAPTGAGTGRDAAFCTTPPQAAFCTTPPGAESAFCTTPPKAAFCTTPPQAAFCTTPPRVAAAFCTTPPKAAFCTTPPSAAFCTAVPPSDRKLLA
jgi:hypothetical protein